LHRKGFGAWNRRINKTLRRKRYHLSASMRNAHVVPSLEEATVPYRYRRRPDLSAALASLTAEIRLAPSTLYS